MATFEQLLEAAARADAAGDESAARTLVQEAQRLRGNSEPSMTPVADPPGYDPEKYRVSNRPNRFGDTVEEATRGPRAALGAYSAGLTGQGPSPTRAALPEGLPPQVAGQLGLAGDLGMTALTGLGTAYAGAAGLAGDLFGTTRTKERQLASDLMMMGEVAAPELAGVTGTVQAAHRAARAADRIPTPQNDRQRQARAADDLGITPSLGMTGRTGATAAATIEKLPIAGNSVAADAARFVGEAESVFDRNVSALGASTNAASAGSQLQRGLNQFVGRWRERSGELYSKVDATIPAETTITAPETVAKIREAIAPFAENPEIASQLGLDRWSRLADDLENGLSWQAARALRSSIGESIGKMNGPLATMDQGRLKQAYASLTNDLDTAVQQVGGDAAHAWNRANTHYRAGQTRIREQLDRTISADSPERAFEAFAAMTRDRSGQANSTRMLRIKRSLGEEEWGEVSATIVDRLGRSNPGAQNAAGDAFSPATFLTNWNRMSDDAKRILLPEATRTELEKLAEVAEAAKDASAERNMSNTGHVVSGVALGGAATHAPLSTSAAILGATISVKGMTNPVFLRAVNRAARGDARQLRAVANGNGPFAQDARTVLRISAAEAAVEGGSANNPYAPTGARAAN